MRARDAILSVAHVAGTAAGNIELHPLAEVPALTRADTIDVLPLVRQ